MSIAQSLDHFVVPVDDIVVAEDFYARVFGGTLGKRNGLNVRQRKRGAVPHTFIQIGGKRMGVYLQSDERPSPSGPRGLPTYSFTTTERGLNELSADLKQLGVDCMGPVRNSHPFAEQTVFFTDPAGNHYAVYTTKDGSADSNPTSGRMTEAFAGYLGTDESQWLDYDASVLVARRSFHSPILVDQGTADKLLAEQMNPHVFADACRRSGQPLELRLHTGYDHGYYFIQTFMEEHLRWHARQLQ